MTDTLVPGAIIAERYQLERLLGEGGMGAVWAATHTLTKKHVALKFLKGAASGDEQLLRRFMREARAASAVNHPNVLAVHDILQQSDGSPVMVLDLLNGKSLADHLAEVHVMPVDELSRVLVPVISAVGTAHAAGIVHRDLKPDNIFLHVRADGEMEPKVLDFGIAKLNATEGEAAATAHLTQTGAMLGTPFYMSPEQVFGERDIDQRADVWAMGVIVYECLSGRRPVDGDNFGQLFRAITMGNIVPLDQVAPQLPADITQLVGRMLQVDKHQRPPDLREPYEVLSKYSSEKAVSFQSAAPPLETERPPPPSTAPMAFEETGLAAQSPPEAAQSAAGAFSLTSNDAEKPRRRWLAIPAVAVLGVAAAVGGWAALHHGAASVASNESTSASAPAAAAPSAPTLPPAVRSAAVTPVANPAPSASTSSSPKPKHAPVVRPVATRKPRSHKTAAAAKPASSAKPRASAQVKLPGSVVGSAPF